MKKALLIVGTLSIIGGAGFAYYTYHKKPAAPTITTAAVTRGDVVDTVGATGTLQAVTTVQVGTQVSGTIQSLYADFNSLVKKGQVLARLDPSLFQTQIEQARANLIRAQADLERLKVSLEDARTKLTRAQELSSRQLIPASDLEAAQVNVRSIDAQIRSSDAQVTQARASLNQNEVNLQHTVISAPIDGLVISRNVDVGQTVAASMQAPTLFILAADLTEMQVVANLDESDVGRIRPGQRVTFRVDAYPTESFEGAVSQVRLQPIVQQNVVTYATVIDVPNPALKLKPGMTANVNVEINKRMNVLRIPNAALRFRPTNEIYLALGQTAPDPADLRAGADGSGRRERPVANAEAPRGSTGERPAPADAPRSTRGGRGGGGFAQRLEGLSPEERQRMIEQFRSRGGRGGAASDDPQAADRKAPTPPAAPAAHPSATTFDALFAPLPPVESAGRVWLLESGQLKPHRVRIGVSDGQNTELLDGDVQEGAELVTNVVVSTPTRPAATSAFPGLGQPQRGGFPGGGFPGGGGGGNRGGAGGRGGR